MIEVAKRMQNMRSHLILQVHDELIVDAVEEEVEEVKALLRDAMENVYSFVVPLNVFISSGNNLFECK